VSREAGLFDQRNDFHAIDIRKAKIERDHIRTPIAYRRMQREGICSTQSGITRLESGAKNKIGTIRVIFNG